MTDCNRFPNDGDYVRANVRGYGWVNGYWENAYNEYDPTVIGRVNALTREDGCRTTGSDWAYVRAGENFEFIDPPRPVTVTVTLTAAEAADIVQRPIFYNIYGDGNNRYSAVHKFNDAVEEASGC